MMYRTYGDNPVLKRGLILISTAILSAVLLSACGGSAEPEPELEPAPTSTLAEQPTATVAPTSPPTPTAAPTFTPTPDPKVSTLEDVQSAVVQLLVSGTFVYPEGTVNSGSGGGSGFIIDPSGLVVTNAHVVQGAATIKAVVNGEEFNARLLGVSPCSDLAVIDIEGDGFNYLDWFTDEIEVGLDVYTAGFPLGDPEFTLTRGIISKAQTDGDTNWASVDSVLEHDATINSGNSGGPLINENGTVVGINYARSGSTNQYFAISAEEALDVIDQLTTDEDVNNIGLNGEAILFEDGSSGIWVISVESGSPVDQVGVQPGDLLLSLEGLQLAEDGTVASFCDVLQGRNATDPMSIELFRPNTGEFLDGTINLDPADELTVASVIDSGGQQNSDTQTSTVSNDDGGDDGSLPTGSAYTNFVEVSDESGSISVEVPTEWAALNQARPDEDSLYNFRLIATTDFDNYNDWDAPGLYVGIDTDLEFTPEEILDVIFEESYGDLCSYEGRDPIEGNEIYNGFLDLYSGCSDTNANIFLIAATPRNSSNYLLVFEYTYITDADFNAIERVASNLDIQVAAGAAAEPTVAAPAVTQVVLSGSNSSATCRVEFWGPVNFHLEAGNGNTQSRQVPAGSYGYAAFLGGKRSADLSMSVGNGQTCYLTCSETEIRNSCGS